MLASQFGLGLGSDGSLLAIDRKVLGGPRYFAMIVVCSRWRGVSLEEFRICKAKGRSSRWRLPIECLLSGLNRLIRGLYIFERNTAGTFGMLLIFEAL